MRAARLVRTVLLLQSRGRLTAQQLATELEVSVRTVYRDVEALGAAGIPVYADRGPHGGYRLLDGYRTTLTGLTGEEAQALVFTGLPGPAAQLGLATAVATARAKVIAALPARIRQAASLAHQRFHLDSTGWFRAPADHAQLEVVASAIWSTRRLAITYRRRDSDVVERVVSPLGVVLKTGTWYLVAEIDGERRAYRISRLTHADLTDETFERPDDFDLPAFWRGWVEEFEASLDSYPVTVRISPEHIARLGMLGDAVKRAEDAAVVGEDGWTRRTLIFERLEYARTALLRFGPGIEVVEPTELREAMTAAVAELADLYLR